MRVPSRRTSLLLGGLSIGLVFLAREVTPTASSGEKEAPVAKVRAGAGELLAAGSVVDDGALASPAVYVSGQVMLPAGSLSVAEAHGAKIIRSAGPGGFAVVSVPGQGSAEEFVAQLRSEGIWDAAPVGVMRGAGKGGKKDKSSADTTTADSTAVDTATADSTAVDTATASTDSTTTASTDTTTTASTDTSTTASTDTIKASTDTTVVKTSVTDSPQCDRYEAAVPVEPAQWHLEAIKAQANGSKDLSGITVAVLDSGVAYQTSAGFEQAASLSGSRFVSPYDFVNLDAVPSDDHMHGTHIASLIASDGAVEGVAPGVTLMPVKVLNENNEGTEVALLDGLAWAVAEGADIINLSLSFDPDYRPSKALIEALQAANEADVVVVAAAGNDGLRTVTWPAAHPMVISVGATGYSTSSAAADWIADYSNRSTALDILAPGGDLTADNNDDGYPDGMLAESIYPRDPSQTGLWFMAGSSQATAVISGVAAVVLASGGAAEDMRLILQDVLWISGDAAEGESSGVIDVEEAIVAACSTSFNSIGPYHLAILPEAKVASGQIQASFVLQLEDAAGWSVENLEILATLSGSSTGSYSCVTDATGSCTITPDSARETKDGLAWALSVDTVVDKWGRTHHPTSMFYASDELELFLAAVDADTKLGAEGGDPSTLLWAWPDNNGDLTAYSASAGGSGLVTTPLGMVFTPNALRMESSSTSYSLDLDGSGLVTTPLGFFSMRLVTLSAMDGSGLVTTPLGFSSRTFMVLDGNATGSFTLNGSTVHEPFQGSDGWLGLSSGESVWLSDGSSAAALVGSSTQVFLDDGAWTDTQGYSVVDQLTGGGAVSVPAEVLGTSLSSSAVAFTP